MATVAQLTPKQESISKSHDRASEDNYPSKKQSLQKQQIKTSHNKHHSKPNKNRSKLCTFAQKEVDMMPGQWAEAYNPTPYELRVTIETCKRYWKLNKTALEHPDCDKEATEYNIKILEKLYLHLMDYLVER